ncbi:MAG: minor capsid protein [Lachnospiraceae bacterium]|nr:minor capsid protein [Lachnospiraceae bacterium]
MDEYDLAKAFQKIEEELMRSMIRNMDHHRAEETEEGIQWSQWQVEQLKALEEYRTKNQEKFGKEFKDLNASIEELIRQAKDKGEMEQEIKILRAIQKGFRGYKRNSSTMQGEFFRVNERKLEALIKATRDDMEKAETAILRRSEDQYRKAIYNAQVYANAGGTTYEKAVDMATKEMLSNGLSCITYANGAIHTLSDYADMAIRTAVKRAYLQGEGTKRQEWGIHTVIMNKRGNACPKCLPFCGKVLIDDVWSGGSKEDGPYPLMSTAIAAGLYHPRCKDVHTTYFEDTSPPVDGTYSRKEIKALEEQNKIEARQQYAERQAEKYERLEKFSLDEENQKRYAVKRDGWKNQVETMKSVQGKTIEEAASKPIAKSSGSGIIKKNEETLKMNLQIFAESDIKNQGSDSLKRAIRKYRKQISEHEDKISHPEQHIMDWDSLDPRMQEGLKRHWNKEIRNFNQSIQDRVEELKVRGDYDE